MWHGVLQAGGLGNHTAATRYSTLAESVEAQIRAGGADWYRAWGMHASADAVIAGIVTPAEGLEMLKETTGVFGDPLQLPSLSNFESFFILKALGKLRATTQAAYLVHRHWAGMLRLGATTFWERFDPQWEDSGCLQADDPPANAMNQDTSMSHPWATGATSFLSEHALGVTATQPGYAAWQAVPLLLETLTWVKGGVPTPHGPIEVDFDLRTGVFELSAPRECHTGRLGIPKLALGIRSVTLGELVWTNSSYNHPDGAAEQAQPPRVEEDARFLYVSVGAGTHRVVVEHVVAPVEILPAAPPSNKWDPNNTDFDFAATLHGTDSTTGGAWRGKFGSTPTPHATYMHHPLS
eukprot:SAG25_NODE_81_length_16694_cov_8.663332_4_plen_351_part_00